MSLWPLADDDVRDVASSEQWRSAVIAELDAMKGVLSLRNLDRCGESLASLLDAYLPDERTCRLTSNLAGRARLALALSRSRC